MPELVSGFATDYGLLTTDLARKFSFNPRSLNENASDLKPKRSFPMFRLFSTALIATASLGLTFATPATSQAQTRYGVHLDFGRTHIDFGNSYYGPYGSVRYDPYRSGYGHGHGHGHHHHHHGYNYGTVVIPETYHWTPYRGWHSHGVIVTPHRNHYHVRPY
jgi:hypothetical protein